MSAAAIRTAVTLCIRHGITPDRLAELIAERDRPAPTTTQPRHSPQQDALRALLIDADAAGMTVTELGDRIGLRSQNTRSQLIAMHRKGLASMAKVQGLASRWFASQALAQEWQEATPAAATEEERTASKRDTILAHALERRAEGITALDVEKLIQVRRNVAHSHLTSMSGRTLWRGKVQGQVIRWFPREDEARAWEQKAREAAKAARYAAIPPRPAKAAPVTLAQRQAPAFTQGDAVIPEGVRITRVPAPLGRFEVAVSEMNGGFSASRPGVNPMTGKGW